jgi:glycosyltransferase involved in cell wall biosynthesis
MSASDSTRTSATGHPVIFVITPAYNAARTIANVYRRFPAEIRAQIAELVVVDDGSTDDTAAELQRLAADDSKLTVLRHTRNRGYGAALKTLLDYVLESDADIVAVVHADGQYAPESLPALLAPITGASAQVVQGSRMLQGDALGGGMPLYKFAANKMLTALENLILGLRMAEFHSGYMVYDRAALRQIPYRSLSNSFDFDLEMIVCAKIRGLSIVEVPIPTRYADETSHLNPVVYGLDVLAVLFRYLTGHYRRLLSDPRLSRSTRGASR